MPVRSAMFGAWGRWTYPTPTSRWRPWLDKPSSIAHTLSWIVRSLPLSLAVVQKFEKCAQALELILMQDGRYVRALSLLRQ